MGFFSDLFGSQNSLETRLIGEYTAAFQAMGVSEAEAKAKAGEMIGQAKQEVVNRGWSNQPANYGDLFLQQEASNPNVREALRVLRTDGVRDEDIRWWWNMDPLERVAIKMTDDMARGGALLALLEQGLDRDLAMKKALSMHARFGNPR